MGRRTALITGGSAGIGKRTAHVLAEEGCNLVLNYHSNKEQAEQLARELMMQYSIEVLAIKGDVSTPEDCQQMVSKAGEAFEGIDILIHNAGPYVSERKTLDDYSYHEWQYILNGNLTSVFYLTKLVLPFMRKRKWGRIITLGFDRAETAPGWIYRSAFAAAKTGVVSLTRTIAMEEALHGITANMVCPGDITGEWKEKTMEEALLVEDSSTPVGRPGTGEDLARVIAFLSSESSSFITGSVIPVTGGKDVLGKVFRKEEQ